MDDEIKREIKGRLISFIDGKFILTFTVFAVSTWLLINNHLNPTAYATVVTGGVFAFDITRNESYSEILKEKIEEKIGGGNK